MDTVTSTNTSSSTDSPSSSHTSEFKMFHSILEHLHLKSTHKNSRLRFLILLPKEDFDKCFYSIKDVLWYRKSKFPGKLIIEPFEDVGDLPYTIEGIPMPRQLYIMLPKEKLFIQSTNFTSRYIDSKMSELKQLFVLLRAKRIKFTKNTKSQKEYHVNGQLNAVVPQLKMGEIGEGLSVSSIQFRLNEQSNEMHFDNTQTHSIEESLKKAKFYYLSREFHWQNIISRRIENHLVYDKYVYRNQEMKLFQSKFINKLKLLEIRADYDWKDLQDLEIEYEIEYYPL